ncbi:hypothetical protein QJS10_CPB15g00884 [Acorus calamus]|uniref:Uncharacterized protein n=1 Tax=Acorus calamus TaxID=4465 RepID=A0AAV9D4L7_ACOCL|nr:hypothetical protein QJS10_CPB15g00884 [Acorus calamus]
MESPDLSPAASSSPPKPSPPPKGGTVDSVLLALSSKANPHTEFPLNSPEEIQSAARTIDAPAMAVNLATPGVEAKPSVKVASPSGSTTATMGGNVHRNPNFHSGKGTPQGEATRPASSTLQPRQKLPSRRQRGVPKPPPPLAAESRSWAQLFPPSKCSTNKDLTYIEPTLEEGTPVASCEDVESRNENGNGKIRDNPYMDSSPSPPPSPLGAQND